MFLTQRIFKIGSHVAHFFGALIAFCSLAGCRLYEPPRYERLTLPPGATVTRVLFIGDSLTYYNDLPGLLQQFSAREPAPIYMEQITGPLQSLQFHWDMGAADRVRSGHWDYVILQDFSTKPANDPKGSLKSFMQFNDEIQRAGGKMIVFQNWTRRGMRDMYDALYKSYMNILEQTPGTFAPIGAAWRDCESQRPDIDLLIDDRHPTDAGTYIAACVLYDVIYHKESHQLPADLPGPKLPQNELLTLREIADRAVASAAGVTTTPAARE